MTEDEYMAFLATQGYVIAVKTGRGRWVGILRLMFHWTMHSGDMFDMDGHDERYCYRTFEGASDALTNWALDDFQGRPTGWHKDPFRKLVRPNGDATKEHPEGEFHPEYH